MAKEPDVVLPRVGDPYKRAGKSDTYEVRRVFGAWQGVRVEVLESPMLILREYALTTFLRMFRREEVPRG